MKAPVHQLVPNLAPGDAISHQVLTLRRLLRELGHPSEIYAQYVAPELRGEARPFRSILSEADGTATALYHFSIGSEVTDGYRLFPGRRLLVYHNITPPEFFRGVNEKVADDCKRGRDELASLCAATDLALADSAYNRRELEGLGFQRTEVFPILLDPSRYAFRPVRRLLRRYRDGALNVLHVGRIVPNKRIEDLLRVFYFLRRKVRLESRLLLVGIETDMEVYGFALRELGRDLALSGVEFVGGVSQRELVTYYRVADFYLCMSEHEGFCVPLLEAMHFGVPVAAYAATAVEETLGDGGILLREKRFPEIAELVAAVHEATALRARLVAAGDRRAREFHPETLQERLEGIVGAAS